MKRLVYIAVAVLMVLGTMAGCTQTTPSPSPTASAAVETVAPTATPEPMYWDLLDSAADSSDLPDWKGPQLNLTWWYAHGAGGLDRTPAENNVVWKEIQRVTGVIFDFDSSFDNGGQSLDNKLGVLAASNDWPDIVSLPETQWMNQLIDNGKIYNLSENGFYDNCPNILKYLDPRKLEGVKGMACKKDTDQVYFFPTNENTKDNNLRSIEAARPEYDATKWALLDPPQSLNYWTISVRDDILKGMYPNAKTLKELKDTYAANSNFTKEEIYDVPIKSTEEFVQFLRDAKKYITDNNITENGKPVEVSLAACGLDNWPLLAALWTRMRGVPASVNYYTYYDKTTGKLEYLYEQPFFKEDLKLFNQLVKEGVLEKESLVNDNKTITEKINNGQYFMTYAWLNPDPTVLKAGGKTFEYRPLNTQIPYDLNRYVYAEGESRGFEYWGIFTDGKVKQENVQQVLRMFDYLASDAGMKTSFWGPRSAGLFVEENGVRAFKDPDLAQDVIYNAKNGKAKKLGLLVSNGDMANRAFPYYPIASTFTVLNPAYNAPQQINRDNYLMFFNDAKFPETTLTDKLVTLKTDQPVWFYFDMPEVDRFFKGRTAFEDALLKCIAASDDAQFEKLYADALAIAESQGLSDKTLEEINQRFSTNNAPYLDKLK